MRTLSLFRRRAGEVRAALRCAGAAAAVVAGSALPAWAQHHHEHHAARADAASTGQLLVLLLAGLLVARTLRDIVRARPWSREPVTEAYERVRRIRGQRQAGGLLLGAVCGLALFSALDSRLHAHAGHELEDPRVAAARARVESTELTDAETAMLDTLLDGTEGAEPAAEVEPDPHVDEAPTDAHAEGEELFHRALLSTVGAALFGLLALALPVREGPEPATPVEKTPR